MEIVKIEGIVIKEMDYKESSKILTILTKEYGSISVISKGCKKIKSKLRCASLKFTYAYFFVNYKPGSLSNLTDATIIIDFKNILNDISKFSYVSYIFELTNEVMKQNNKYDLIFKDMISAVIKINENLDERIITNIIEIKYLQYLGILPVIDSCSCCESENNIITISIKDGGYICKDCYKEGKIYDNKVLKLIKLFYLVDLAKVNKLDVKDNIIKDIDEFITLYYNEYTGLYLKTKDFLKKIAR